MTIGAATLMSAGDSDIFLTKLDATSSPVWAASAGGTGLELVSSVVVSGDGSAYLTGWYVGSTTFGSTTLTSAGGVDLFLAKYDGDGNAQWALSAGGTENDYGNQVSVSADGSVYLVGFFTGAATLGSVTLTTQDVLGMFLAKYAPDGTLAWAKTSGGNGSTMGNAGMALSNGTVYVAGAFSKTVTFGATPLTTVGVEDMFLAKCVPTPKGCGRSHGEPILLPSEMAPP